jgi:hypothetical protein
MQWVQGAVSVVVKREGREAYHSPTSNAEVKDDRNDGIIIPLPIYRTVVNYCN